jgi:hypothetical protein
LLSSYRYTLAIPESVRTPNIFQAQNWIDAIFSLPDTHLIKRENFPR